MTDAERYNKAEEVVNTLTDHGFSLFLGGSRRFGWHNDASDFDYFVYHNDGLGDARDRLRGIFHNIHEAGTNYDYPATSTLVVSERILPSEEFVYFHITVFNDHHAWTTLMEEHYELNEYLEHRPYMYSEIENSIFRGKDLYRKLIRLMRGRCKDL